MKLVQSLALYVLIAASSRCFSVLALKDHTDVGVQGFLKGAVFTSSKEEPHEEAKESEGAEEAEGKAKEAEGKEAEGEEGEEEGKPIPGSAVGQIVAFTLGGLLILSSLTFALANSSNKSTKSFTLHTLDNTICIFLAVLMFQAVDEALVDSGLISEEHLSFCFSVYAIVALAAVIGVSYMLRGVPVQLAVFTAAAAHFTSFAWMHVALVHYEVHAVEFIHAVFVFIGVLLAIPVVYVGAYKFKEFLGVTENDELLDKIDDVEADAGAFASSISWTILILYGISGKYQNVEEKEEAEESERHALMLYAILVTFLFLANLTLLNNVDGLSYVRQRAYNTFKSFMAMSVAWAWLLWGKWHFHGHLISDQPLLACVAFALGTSLVGLILIAVMGQMNLDHSYSKYEHFLALTVVGLLVGWTWEEVFDVSIESLAEADKSAHPGVMKMGALVLMIAVILPVHVIYFKPLVMKQAPDE